MKDISSLALHHTDTKILIPWSAILIGGLVIVGLSFLSNLLSFSIGLSAFSIVNGKTAFALGGFILLAATAIITMFIGGWITGYVAKFTAAQLGHGSLYGFLAWTLALIITVLLTTQVSQFLNRYNNMIGREAAIVRVLPSELTPPSSFSQNIALPVPSQEASSMGSITLIGFFLFTIGAISATFGGYMGMGHRNRY